LGLSFLQVFKGFKAFKGLLCVIRYDTIHRVK